MSLERLKEKVLAIQARIPVVRGRGEEATKQALVLPMLDALGFDVWNPGEVSPEFEADFATKKAGQKEKVDLAVILEGAPRVFIEVKAVDEVLDGHQGQLARYFNGVPSVSLGILTNGVEYRFFTDTGEPNLLDAQPFHVLRVDAVDLAFDVLGRFHKAVFSAGAIRSYATELNYTARLVALLRTELDLRSREPSDALVRWLLGAEGMYEGRIMPSVVERFRPIVRNALQIVLRDIVRRSVAALDEGVNAPEPQRSEAEAPAAGAQQASPASAQGQATSASAPPQASQDASGEGGGKSAINTTEAELRAFAILKEQFQNSALSKQTILDGATRKEVPIEVAYKDTTVYFGVYFNKPSYWFVRLQLEGKQPWIALNLDPKVATGLLPTGTTLLNPSAFGEVRVPIRSADDLHGLNRMIFAAMQQTIEERKSKATESG